MALETVKEIIARIATDKEFRDKFFNPKSIEEILGQYKGKLTQEEKNCLYVLTPESVEQYVSKAIYSCSDIRI